MALSKKQKEAFRRVITDDKAADVFLDSFEAVQDYFTESLQIVDQSVNHGITYVNDIGNLVIRTEQSSNVAGNFNGSGTGNKALGGLPNFNKTLVHSLSKFSYDFMSVDALHASSGAYCYLNALMDLNGNGSDVRVVVFCFNNATLNLRPCDRVVNGDGSISISFDKTLHGVMVVGNPIAGVVPVVGTDLDSFSARRYLFDDIAAVYPNAQFIDAVHTDGGLGKYTKHKAVMFTLGDSSTNACLYAEIYNVKINGVAVSLK